MRRSSPTSHSSSLPPPALSPAAPSASASHIILASPQPPALSAAASSSSPRNSSSSSSSTSSTSSPPSTATSRLQQISKHIMSTPANSFTCFPADIVPQAPEDPLFGLMAAYRADESPDKVDLVRVLSFSRSLVSRSPMIQFRLQGTQLTPPRALVHTATTVESRGFCPSSKRFVFFSRSIFPISVCIIVSLQWKLPLHALLPTVDTGQLPSQKGRNRP